MVVDSRSQCIMHGDVSYAVKRDFVKKEQLIELGEVIIDLLHNPGDLRKREIFSQLTRSRFLTYPIG